MSVAQGNAKFSVARSGYTMVAISIGTFIAGTAVTLSLSASACFLSHVIRCFSLSRDLAGFLVRMIGIWALPALIMGLLVTVVARIRGSVVWWNVLLVAGLVSAVEFAMSVRRMGNWGDAPVFLALGLVLFVGAQLSRLASNRFGANPI